MNGKNDLLEDILPMVISGILDPKYITGEDSSKEKTEKEEDNDSERDDRSG